MSVSRMAPWLARGSLAARRRAAEQLCPQRPAAPRGLAVPRLHAGAAAPAARIGLRTMSGMPEGAGAGGGPQAAAEEGHGAAQSPAAGGGRGGGEGGHQTPEETTGPADGAGNSVSRLLDAADVDLGTVPSTWVGRMIGYHGEAIKHLQAKTGAVFKFHQQRDKNNRILKGLYDVPVTMTVPKELAHQAEAMYNNVRYMQGLRDDMAAFSYENRHWNCLHTFNRLRRDSKIVDLPMTQADYNLALSMCGIVCHAQSAENIYAYLVSDKEPHAVASPRTWSIFCGSVVAAGNIAPALACIDLAVERGNVPSRGEALTLLEAEIIRSRTPRVAPSLQLILALHREGTMHSDRLHQHSREACDRATDAIVVQHLYAEAVAEGVHCPAANGLMLRLALHGNQVVPAVELFAEYLELLPSDDEAMIADARRVLADVLSCCAWWRRLDLADRCWELYAARGLEPDRRVHSARVLVLSNCGKFARMFAALSEMRAGVGAEVSSQLAEAIAESMSLSRGRVVEASDELKRLAREGKEVPVTALLTTVLAVGRVLDLKMAFELYETVVPSLAGGHAPILVFNGLLSLCALHGRLDAAEATLSYIRRSGLEPDAESHAQLVRTALRAGDVVRAAELSKTLAPASGDTGPQSQSMLVLETAEMLRKVIGVSGSLEERAAAIFGMMGVDDHVWKEGAKGTGQRHTGSGSADA